MTAIIVDFLCLCSLALIGTALVLASDRPLGRREVMFGSLGTVLALGTIALGNLFAVT